MVVVRSGRNPDPDPSPYQGPDHGPGPGPDHVKSVQVRSADTGSSPLNQVKVTSGQFRSVRQNLVGLSHIRSFCRIKKGVSFKIPFNYLRNRNEKGNFNSINHN